MLQSFFRVSTRTHSLNSEYVIQVGFIKSLKLYLFLSGKVDKVPDG